MIIANSYTLHILFIVEVLIICAIIRLINANMAIRIFRISGINKDIARLWLGPFDTLPTIRKAICCIITAVSAGRTLTKIQIVVANEINTLRTVHPIIVQTLSNLTLGPSNCISGRMPGSCCQRGSWQQTDDHQDCQHKT